MKHLILLPFVFCFLPFAFSSEDPWPSLLSSAGLLPGVADVHVIRDGDGSADPQWIDRVENGAFLILEGESVVARSFGFRKTGKRVRVSSIEDLRRPALSIVWERALELPVFEIPADAQVFTRERRGKAPLVAGFKGGAGAVLWVAASPGTKGYERFPYLLHALADLGLKPPFRSRRLWAFLDSSYRLRADLEYFARRWRDSGIAALHVAAWHFYDPDPQNDSWLRELIDQCHRRGIQVYAWLELPHVSEKFWQEHPEWREKTALLQDAHLDWRKLMNLANRDCFGAVSAGVARLIDRFDWDGVNLAELYFESLEGHAKPSRFTPMNDDVRREFRERFGFDPLELFDPAARRHYSKDPAAVRAFLDYRSELSGRIQAEWISGIEALRGSKPDLDLVLTHIDDRFDKGMRDALGADAARILPMLDRHNFTFLIEDPATVWHLGPERYQKIADQYRGLTARAERLAIDINIVERYQDVYPTKQQTGAELFQLVHTAARAFPRVALYFESSILAPDAGWLASAAAVVDRFERAGSKLVVDAPHGAGIRWEGTARVDGRSWPACDGETLWLPAGRHAVEPASEDLPIRLLDFTGDLRTAGVIAEGVEFAYESSARAYAILDKRPLRVEIDGVAAEARVVESEGRFTLVLPRGQHLVTIYAE